VSNAGNSLLAWLTGALALMIFLVGLRSRESC